VDEDAVVTSPDMAGGFPSLHARNSSAITKVTPSGTPALDVVHKSALQRSRIVSQNQSPANEPGSPSYSNTTNTTVSQSSPPPASRAPRSLLSVTQTAPIWCAYHTSTFITITTGPSLSSDKVNWTLTAAAVHIQNSLHSFGDRNVDGGNFLFNVYLDLQLTIDEARGEKLRWSVMADAVGELLDWMTTTSTWVAVQFFIVDGSDEVGSGVLQARDPGP